MRDHIQLVSEEIHIFLGLETNVIDNKIEVDTIAGKLSYECCYKDNLMADVYRFINNYGLKLAKHGLENKLNCETSLILGN